ncbi:plasmid maintenance system killer protein [Helicobacter sp. 12S02232-10]|uniref:type II toxin-antitoxin system RelE/ParE family toxin n=1 Tax=Helicobacter sp. 12S02232-10 TaxID=1476197 RepID=UPI000BA7E514|nr:type II toxin-antitoxin system RelE/ParE family toxin [Helicobacter sp. 12S02232-10]PAF49077.1 plasmid maintenance system killer protein [Helicobacter sp. 12S02232-10]
MIQSFKNKETKRLFETGEYDKLPPDVVKRALLKLDFLNAANDLSDLKSPPSNHLKLLKGELKGFYSIRINDQFRLCFRFERSDAYEVFIVDYHK